MVTLLHVLVYEGKLKIIKFGVRTSPKPMTLIIGKRKYAFDDFNECLELDLIPMLLNWNMLTALHYSTYIVCTVM